MINDDAYHVDCTSTGGVCGDGTLDPHEGENCDDGNQVPGDDCDASCRLAGEDQVVAITTGGGHTCALANKGGVRCWGAADGMFAQGQLGNGSFMGIGDEPGEMPPPQVAVGGPATQISAGFQHTCVVHDDGTLRCFGTNFLGTLGLGHTQNIGDEPAEMPPATIFAGGPVTRPAMPSEGQYSCALFEGGVVRCWGLNDNGQLGLGHAENIGDSPDELPPEPTNVGGVVTQLATGHRHACALLDGGTVRCWGANFSGELGYGHTEHIGDEPGEMPPPDVNVGGVVVQIAAGWLTTCAVLQTGEVRCWGSNTNGKLGLGHTNNIGDDETPASAGTVDVGGTVNSLAMADAFSCALLDSGAVRCWGSGQYGGLGYGNTEHIGNEPGEMPPPDLLLGGTVEAIDAGGFHACALMTNHEVRCWGHGGYGQLGYGDTETIGDEPGEMPPAAVQVL